MFGKIKEMLSLEKWIDNFEGYLEAKIDLVKFDIREGIIKLISKSLVHIVFILFGFAAFVLLNFGIAGLLNQYLESQYLGYLILSALYFAVSAVFFLFRNDKNFQIKIEAKIRESMTPKPDENEPNS